MYVLVFISFFSFLFFFFLRNLFGWSKSPHHFDNKDLFLEGDEEDKKKRKKYIYIYTKETIKTFNDNILRTEE